MEVVSSKFLVCFASFGSINREHWNQTPWNLTVHPAFASLMEN